MTSYYDLLRILKDEIEATELVNTITQGDMSALDINKKNLYPLAHVMVDTGSFVGATIVYNVSIYCIDILDISKLPTTDEYRGNDNEFDVLNSTITILNRVFEKLRRKLHNVEISEAQLEKGVNKGTNGWAGWQMSFDVVLPANMPIC